VDNRQASQATTGVIIIVVGLLLLVGQLDGNWHFGRLWPVILIAMGAGRFLATTPDGRRGNGISSTTFGSSRCSIPGRCSS